MLELANIHKCRRNKAVLRGVSARIEAGQIVGLVGPNGAGKSTLLETAAGVLRLDSGTVKIDGRSVHTDYRAKSLVTTAFQQVMFDAMLTPLEALGGVDPLPWTREVSWLPVL
ncbi:MAG: ATP-binding cassette domain-containing protein [Bacillota bacterium]